jgi:hypothetical protein
MHFDTSTHKARWIFEDQESLVRQRLPNPLATGHTGQRPGRTRAAPPGVLLPPQAAQRAEALQRAAEGAKRSREATPAGGDDGAEPPDAKKPRGAF